MKRSFYLLLLFCLWNCDSAKQANVEELDFSKMPFKKLSEYGIFKDELKALTPSERVLRYEPVSMLFTDYAHKSRFVWMRKGKQATLQQNDSVGMLNFPDETMLIKNFYYPTDMRQPEKGKRIIETRLLVKRKRKWDAFPYVWNAEQTDADLKVIGASFPVSWTDEQGQLRETQYVVPNKNQCKSCHNYKENLMPIGVKAMYLNHEITYTDGKKNQLAKWKDVGFLDAHSDVEKILPMINADDTTQSIENRARAYLDINCSHCHQANGPASSSGLYLSYRQTDAKKLGIFKTPVSAGIGAGNLVYDIVPGKSEQSIMVHRMNSTAVSVAMPEIGRTMIHREGVALIKQWIDGMNASEYSSK